MLGISRVVNVTENVPNYFEKDEGGQSLDYFNISVTDSPDAAKELARHIQGAVAFICETVGAVNTGITSDSDGGNTPVKSKSKIESEGESETGEGQTNSAPKPIPIPSPISSPSADSMDSMDSMASRGGGAVLVHCEFGVSRSATIVTAFLMQSKGWSFEQGLRFLKTRRPKVKPNLGFREVLSQLELERTP